MMQKNRALGRTGLRVSPIGLGTVELGLDYGIQVPGHFGRPDENAAQSLLDAALDAGINLIDTARGYGESEAVLGRVLRGKWDGIVLATKASAHDADGRVPNATALRQQLITQLETSLRLLQTDHIDLWQIHNVDREVLAMGETVAAVFANMQQAGKIRWRGGSFYGAALPVAALQHDLFDVIQVTYSVFDQRITDQLLPLARQQNIGVMVRSVLLKGALTERADHLPDHLQQLRAHSQHYRQRVAELLPTLTPAQAALAFALAQEQISTVLVGMRTVDELASNLLALATTLSPDVLQELAVMRLDDEDLLNPGTWGIP